MMCNQMTINVSLGQMTLSGVPKVLGRGSRMHIKEVPIGQILMLALLMMLIGIGTTAMMKKANASSKARKRMFWGSIIAGVVVALIGVLGINGLFSSRKSYTWGLYPWQMVKIFKLAIIALAELGYTAMIVAVMVVVWIILSRLVIYAWDKLLPKVSKWYNNLTK